MKCNNCKKVCPKIKYVAWVKGLPQSKVNDLLGISSGTWSKWNRQVILPNLPSLISFCNSLGIPLRYIIDDTLRIEEVV